MKSYTALLLAAALPPVTSVRAEWSPGRPASVCLSHYVHTPAGLDYPRTIALDEVHGKIYVADFNRVLRYSAGAASQNGAAPEAILGRNDFSDALGNAGTGRTETPSALIYANGSLWVADQGNNRVMRFDNAHTKSGVVAPDCVLGQPYPSGSGSGLSNAEFDHPYALAMDGGGRLYVADSNNNRVLRFDNAQNLATGAAANAVFGQDSFKQNTSGFTANRLHNPRVLAVSTSGTSVQLWVGDAGNDRVIRYDNAGAATTGPVAAGVLGQAGFVEAADAQAAGWSFDPFSLAVDASGRLYVGDWTHCRILRFDSPLLASSTSATNNLLVYANAVLGQPNLTTSIRVASAGSSSYNPSALVFSSTGELWVADDEHHRAGKIPNPMAGSAFTVSLGAPAVSPAGEIARATGTAVSPVDGRLYVTDDLKKTLHRYTDPTTLTTGAQSAARLVFNGSIAPSAPFVDKTGVLYCLYGHSVLRFPTPATDLTSYSTIVGTADVSGVGAYTLDRPSAVCADGNGTLWVADTNNYRVMQYKRNGSGSWIYQRVLGQATFNTDDYGTSNKLLDSPKGLALDSAGRLYIADYYNDRVVWVNNSTGTQSGVVFDGLIGQPTWDEVADPDVNATSANSPVALAFDNLDRLWVANDYRVTRYDHPHDAVPVPSVLIGQEKWDSESDKPVALHMTGEVTSLTLDKSGCLWMADPMNRRALKHSPDVPRAISTQYVQGVGLRVGWTVEPGVNYRLQYSTNLQTWIEDPNPVVSATAPLLYDYNIFPGHKYFRLRCP